MTVHTNGTIRIQCGTQQERLNGRRVTPFVDEQIRNSNYIVISYYHQSYANLIVILSLHLTLILPNHSGIFFTHWVFFSA
jgi:hypothetical protein